MPYTFAVVNLFTCAMQHKPLNVAVAEATAETLKVAGHPTRLAILNLLRQQPDGANVGAIAQAVEVAQPIASQHLIIMRDRGVLWSQKNGTTVTYGVVLGQVALVDSILAVARQ